MKPVAGHEGMWLLTLADSSIEPRRRPSPSPPCGSSSYSGRAISGSWSRERVCVMAAVVGQLVQFLVVCWPSFESVVTA